MIMYHPSGSVISRVNWSDNDIQLFIKRNLGNELWNEIKKSGDYKHIVKVVIASIKGGVCSDTTLYHKEVKRIWNQVKESNEIYRKGAVVASKAMGITWIKKLIKNMINIKFIKKNVDYYSKSLSVVLLIKNCEQYFPFFEYVFTELESEYASIEYHIYENDSTDLTVPLLKRFMENRKGNFFSQNNTNNKDHGGIKKERGVYMCNLRNELKRKHGELHTDYTLLMDCDTYFDPSCVIKLLTKFSEYPDIAMAASFCKAWDIFRDHKCVHYYDTLALITEDGLSYKDTDNSCLMESCNWCENRITKRGLLDKRYPDDMDDIKVRSAFGGLVAIPTHIYSKVWWEPTICEHHGFCEQVRKYGTIVVSRGIETFIAKPRDTLVDRSKIISLLYL
jgi:hypothetical protein